MTYASITWKRDFRAFYTATTPLQYLTELVRLDWVLPRATGRDLRVILEQLPPCPHILDVCSSYGFNSAHHLYGESIDDWYTRLAKAPTDKHRALDAERFLPALRVPQARVTGFDVSAPALHYAKSVGLLDMAFQVDLSLQQLSLPAGLTLVDLILATACTSYIHHNLLPRLAAETRARQVYFSVLFGTPVEPIIKGFDHHGYSVKLLQSGVDQRLADPLEIERGQGQIAGTYLASNTYLASRAG
jgi:hypothetical protein